MEHAFDTARLLIVKTGALYSLSGTLACDLATARKAHFVGFGVPGHLAAAAYAAAAGREVAFIRTERKTHGTCRQIEGAASLQEWTVVFCAACDRERCLAECEKLGVAIDGLCSVEAVTSRDFPRSFECRAEIVPVPMGDLAAAVKVREDGPFVLSSGRAAQKYYETLPAACRFDVVSEAFLQFRSEFDRKREVIGAAYGGTYFAALAALLTQKVPRTLDPALCRGGLEVAGGLPDALVCEDYVTTGRTAALVYTQLAGSGDGSARRKQSRRPMPHAVVERNTRGAMTSSSPGTSVEQGSDDPDRCGQPAPASSGAVPARRDDMTVGFLSIYASASFLGCQIPGRVACRLPSLV